MAARWVAILIMLLPWGLGIAAAQTDPLIEAGELEDRFEVLYRGQRYDEALPIAQRIMVLREATLGPDNSQVLHSLGNIAATYKHLRRFAEAAATILRILASYDRLQVTSHQFLHDWLIELARMYAADGRLADAEPVLLRALVMEEALAGPTAPGVGVDLNALGALYRKQKRYAEAEAAYTRALAILEAPTGLANLQVDDTRRALRELRAIGQR